MAVQFASGALKSRESTQTQTWDDAVVAVRVEDVAVQDTEPQGLAHVWFDTDDPEEVSIPEYSDLSALAGAVGIVVDGNVAQAACTAVGQYVILQNSAITGKADGLYKAAATFSKDATIDGTYLQGDNGNPLSMGGLNDLRNTFWTSSVTNIHASAKLRGSLSFGKYGKIVSPLGYFWITNDIEIGQVLASIDDPSFIPYANSFLSIHKTGSTSVTGAINVNTSGNITTGDFPLAAGYYAVTGSYMTN